MKPVYINAVGVISAYGAGLEALRNGLAREKTALSVAESYSGKKLGIENNPERQNLAATEQVLGRYLGELPDLSLQPRDRRTRNNRFAAAAIAQIEATVAAAIQRVGEKRVGVIIGTSTSGLSDAEKAFKHRHKHRLFPSDYDYQMQEMGATADFVALHTKVTGPSYGISTACSSGAKALASGQRLINAGICDVVIAGGVDTICHLTLQGFTTLEAISKTRCNPFSRNRNGINIGEAAALFVLSKKPAAVSLRSAGESSDAYHISAPDPGGRGAIACMQAALAQAKLSSDQIDYLNLHGTGTELNDAMEAQAVATVFPHALLCSSTKGYTGHCLGAAGAIEAAICYSLLRDSREQGSTPWLATHLWDGQSDPTLPHLNFTGTENQPRQPLAFTMSNSFAFGGNNISLIFEGHEE